AVAGQALLFPVNYALSGRIIVCRSPAGSKLFNAREERVAIEIDGYDEQTGVRWSVMVQGIAHDATESYDDISWAAHAVLPRPMAPGPKPYQVAIEPTSITGRRFSGPGSD